jgi:hypothetical protein
MKIEFEDGSFLQVEGENQILNLIQCAKKDRKVMMSSVRLTKDQALQLFNFLNDFCKITSNK